MKSFNFALITGGSSGLGKGFAYVLAEQGTDLVLVSNQVKELEETKTEIVTRFGIRVETLYCDLSKTESASEIFEFCNNQDIFIDLLVNNAGVMWRETIVNQPIERIDAAINISNITPIKLCKLFASKMIDEKRGYIVNVGSISAWQPSQLNGLYNPLKALIVNFSKVLNYELYRYGINVTCICPGAMDTALFVMNDKTHKRLISVGIMHRGEDVAKKALKGVLKNKVLTFSSIFDWSTTLLYSLIPKYVRRTH